MKKGELKGGKIATPVREMIGSPLYNGVRFHCDNERAAEGVRMAALMLRKRNGYDIRTTKRGSSMVVYKGPDTDEPEWFDVDNRINIETEGMST